MMLPIDSVYPNVWNPSSMREEQYQSLLKDMAKGNCDPILVTPNKVYVVPMDGYTIVDGFPAGKRGCTKP